MNRLPACNLFSTLALVMAGCASAPPADNLPAVRYVGSSTIGHFIRDAEPAFGQVRFILDTTPESVGGEQAIREGRADLAGVAGRPRPETLGDGVIATLFARDAIAVVVHPENPVSSLTSTQLQGVFTGATRNWKDLGGPDLEIRPFIAGPESATRSVFRAAILGEADYDGCEVVRPSEQMVAKVQAQPGGIGQISFSFLVTDGHVKTLAIDGQAAVPTNLGYPITRPLYLLWWPGRDRVAAFISWTGSAEAEAILLRRFATVQPSGEHR